MMQHIVSTLVSKLDAKLRISSIDLVDLADPHGSVDDRSVGLDLPLAKELDEVVGHGLPCRRVLAALAVRHGSLSDVLDVLYEEMQVCRVLLYW